MDDKLKTMSNEELKKKVLSNYIQFFVFLAIATGLIITSIALGAFGKQPLLVNLIPSGIAVLCCIPLFSLFKKANTQKKELQNR